MTKPRGAGLAVLVFPLALVLTACVSSERIGQGPLTRIGFGSCINTQAHPMLDRTLTLPFELFILLGDNIYGTKTPDAFKRKFERPYADLLSKGVKFYASTRYRKSFLIQPESSSFLITLLSTMVFASKRLKSG